MKDVAVAMLALPVSAVEEPCRFPRRVPHLKKTRLDSVVCLLCSCSRAGITQSRRLSAAASMQASSSLGARAMRSEHRHACPSLAPRFAGSATHAES